MPAKKTSLPQAEQSRRFLEAAEEVGVDGALFERAFAIVASAPAAHSVTGVGLPDRASPATMVKPAGKKKKTAGDR